MSCARFSQLLVEGGRWSITDLLLLTRARRYRLFGIFPIISWAQSLNSPNSAPTDTVQWWIQLVQVWSMLIYYPLEHWCTFPRALGKIASFARDEGREGSAADSRFLCGRSFIRADYLAGKGVFKLKPEKSSKVSLFFQYSICSPPIVTDRQPSPRSLSTDRNLVM